MKNIIIIFLILMVGSAHAELGDEDDFSQIIVYTAEGTLPTPEPFSFMLPDPKAERLRESLSWDDSDVEQFRSESEVFFQDRFGIDFSMVPSNSDGIKIIPGVGMLALINFTPEAGYRAVLMDGKRVNRPVDMMAYVVIITGSDVVYHGEYGGVEGIPAYMGEVIASGVYHIRKSHENPYAPQPQGDVIFFKQYAAARGTPDALFGVFCDLFHSEWGVGSAEGTTGLTILPDGGAKIFVRLVLTFPGRKSDISEVSTITRNLSENRNRSEGRPL
jgi:hypothetical protein